MRDKIMNKRTILVGIVLLAVTGIGVFYSIQLWVAKDPGFALSGTIEATEINVPTIAGGRVKQVYAAEGDPVRKSESLALVSSVTTAAFGENVTSPIDGVVLERLVEPGEYAAPGSTVMVVASLDALTLTIYVPEGRYGQVSLGESIPVSVDSFAGESFDGKVIYISDQAEFTPRNVQTKESRETTVYAVKLALAPSGGKLKPGMPADAMLP